MEGLIILAILALIFRNVFSKQGSSWKKLIKEFTEEGKPQQTRSSPWDSGQTVAKPKSQPKATQRKTTGDSEKQLNREFVRTEVYVPIRSRLEDVRLRSTDGSMDPYSLEGTASAEGESNLMESMDTQRQGRQQDRIVQESTDEPHSQEQYPHTILPAQLSGDAIVQAVVMHEILSRTRKRGG